MKYDEITACEAQKISNQMQGQLIDVRSLIEYKEYHIEGALHLPLEKIVYEAEQVLEEKKLPIILYCRSGHRTKTARVLLEELGYEAVYDLGGINKWIDTFGK